MALACVQLIVIRSQLRLLYRTSRPYLRHVHHLAYTIKLINDNIDIIGNCFASCVIFFGSTVDLEEYRLGLAYYISRSGKPLQLFDQTLGYHAPDQNHFGINLVGRLQFVQWSATSLITPFLYCK